MSLDIVRRLPFSHPFRWNGKKFGGSALWKPVTTRLWLDAYNTDSIQQSGGAVSQWNDLSGNGLDFPQATESFKPSSGTRKLNTYNVIDFDGVDDKLKRSTIGHANDFMFFIIGVHDAGTCYYSENGSGGQAYNIQSTGLSLQTNGTINFPVAIAASQPFLISLKADWTNTLASLYLDGALVGSKILTAVLGNGIDTRIGANFVGGSPANFGCGEIIIVNDVTDATRQLIEGYLAHKWGIE